MAVEEGDGGAGGDTGGRGDNGEEARRLTVEDRADLWEWFEEFVEDLSMDVSKVKTGGVVFCCGGGTCRAHRDVGYVLGFVGCLICEGGGAGGGGVLA